MDLNGMMLWTIFNMADRDLNTPFAIYLKEEERWAVDQWQLFYSYQEKSFLKKFFFAHLRRNSYISTRFLRMNVNNEINKAFIPNPI